VSVTIFELHMHKSRIHCHFGSQQTKIANAGNKEQVETEWHTQGVGGLVKK